MSAGKGFAPPPLGARSEAVVSLVQCKVINPNVVGARSGRSLIEGIFKGKLYRQYVGWHELRCFTKR